MVYHVSPIDQEISAYIKISTEFKQLIKNYPYKIVDARYVFETPSTNNIYKRLKVFERVLFERLHQAVYKIICDRIEDFMLENIILHYCQDYLLNIITNTEFRRKINQLLSY